MKKTMIAAALLLALTGARAEFFSGNELLKRIDGEPMDKAMALGFVIGVYDATRGAVHCPPAEVTAGQIRDMAAQFIREAPTLRHRPASTLVAFTLSAAWPCAKKPAASL